jgi:hypothetical protein
MWWRPEPRSDDSDTIRVLNQPQALAVEADGNGLPRVVGDGMGRRRVEAILDVWRIDDEWWRSPISRRYFLVALDDGVPWTIFHDLIGGAWYAQRY